MSSSSHLPTSPLAFTRPTPSSPSSLSTSSTKGVPAATSTTQVDLKQPPDNIAPIVIIVVVIVGLIGLLAVIVVGHHRPDSTVGRLVHRFGNGCEKVMPCCYHSKAAREKAYKNRVMRDQKMVLAKAKHDAAHQHHQRNLPPMTQLSQPSDLESQPLSSILTHQPTIHHLTLPNLNLSVNVAHRDSYTAPPTARLHPAGTKLVQPSSRPDLEDVTELSEPPTAVSSVMPLPKDYPALGSLPGSARASREVSAGHGQLVLGGRRPLSAGEV